MAYKTFVAGDVLTASDVNTYLAKQAVIVVANSASRPSSPTQGMTVYEQDTNRLLTYTTATTGWQPPWNTAWGVKDYSKITSNSASVSSTAGTNLATMTLSIVEGRLYRFHANGILNMTTNGDRFQVLLKDSGGSEIARLFDFTGPNVGTVSTVGSTYTGGIYRHGFSGHVMYVAATTTTTTFSFWLSRSGGSGSATIDAAASAPAYYAVEDVGATAQPV